MGAPRPAVQKPGPSERLISTGTGVLVIFLILFSFFRERSKPAEKIMDQSGLTWDDVAYVDENGEIQIREWRLEGLYKKLEEFEEAEQYALIAQTAGIYECYHCNDGTCYLQKGMVWKYGVTRRGVGRRYSGEWLTRMRLDYITQFQGTNQACLIEEKRKIILYPMHPDNQARNLIERMARPPGNKNDN